MYQRGVTTPRLVLWVSCVAQLMVVLDASVMNVAVPSVREDLALSAVGTSWIVLAYTLGFAGLILAGARLADVFGATRTVLGGVLVFTIASVVGGLAVGGGMLIAARAVQGVAAAVLSPATFSLLTIWFPEGRPRVRAVAIWTGASLAGGGLGNIVSGVLTEYVSWRAVLLINLPIGAAVAAAAYVLTRAKREVVRGRVGVLGSVLVTGAFTAAAYAASSAGDENLANTTPVAACVSGVLFVALVVQQRMTRVPLVPPRLWRNRAVITGNAATLLAGACFQVAVWYFLTFLMQQGMGYPAAATGLGFLPLTGVMLVVSTWVAPRLLDRYPIRVLVATGSVIAALGFLAQWLIPVANYPVTVLLPSIIIGLGGGLLNTPLATAVTQGIDNRDAGAASGLMNTAKQFGGAIGLAMLATFTPISEYQSPFAIMAVLIVAAGLAGLLIPRVTVESVSRSGE
jgi:EmrB/QacA subfamily drug resistance transporter